MSNWPTLQSDVAAALRAPELAPPGPVTPLADGTIPVKRFNVYRNNVALSLINALADSFPVVRQLVGEKFFSTMARHFIAGNLPKTPVMLSYGSDFPEFIKTYEPADRLTYLADLARLEWARNAAYHGRDEMPLAIDSLANWQEHEIPALLFSLHPTIALIQSPAPIVSIWHAHQQDDPETALANLPETGESAMVLRPHLDVLVHPLPAAAFAFTRALDEGKSFASAVEAGARLDPAFDIAANLAGLFTTGAVVHVALATK